MAMRKCRRRFGEKVPFLRFITALAALVMAPAVVMAATINVNGPVLVAYGNSEADDGSDRTLDPNNNTVNVNEGGAVEYAVAGSWYGSRDIPVIYSANENRVNIAAGASAGDVLGGNLTGYAAGTFTVSKNVVSIKGAASGEIRAGQVSNLSEGDIEVTKNELHFEGATITSASIMGARGFNNNVAPGKSVLEYNSISINGGSFETSRMYGAWVWSDNPSEASANHNTISISGAPDMAGVSLYGGLVSLDYPGTPYADADYSGNRLEMKSPGLTIANMYNFGIIDFHLPEDQKAGTTPLLNVTGTADVTGNVVNIHVADTTPRLQLGDELVLIDAGTLTGGDSAMAGTCEQGLATSVLFDFVNDRANQLVARVTALEVGRNEKLKSLSESRMGGLGMLTIGADMLEGHAMPQLRAMAPSVAGLTPFAVMGGSTMRYKSGSHVDVDGFNLVTGLGWNSSRNAVGCQNLLLGAFFEAGWGSYDSHNSFATGSVKGEGDSNYYGGGIMARYDTSFGLYAEGSFRIGEVDTDYKSNDFDNVARVDFDTTSTYYGAHVGLGYLWKITEAAGLDVYSKYHWTRQDSDSVNIEGDRFHFDKMDSHRLRLGTRYSYCLMAAGGSQFTPYVGAAYEHEFDSKSGASVAGVRLGEPDVKGVSGIGELGVSYKPSAESRFSADLGVQGYVGKREGVRGTFMMGVSF